MRTVWIAAGIAAGLAGPAGAADYDRVFAFGDSLSDTGRVFALTLGQVPPSPPYYAGRFSNGPVWVESLPPLIGANPAETANFAYGGAETGVTSSPGVPGVQAQVAQFAIVGPGGRAAALFSVWGGGNDYLNGVAAGADPTPLVDRTVGNLVQAVERLALLGGRAFVVPNLPDLGLTPGAAGSPRSPALSAAVAAHNARLAAAMADVERRLGVKVVVADVASFFQAVRANPAAYGFTNLTVPCLVDDAATGACPTPEAANATLFWDEIHPTAAAHLLLAQFAAGSVGALNDAAEEVAVQPYLGVALARGWHNAVLQNAGTQDAAEGRLAAFLIGDAAWGHIGMQDGLAGFSTETQVAGIGAELAVAPGSRVGLSLGFGDGTADLSGDAGKVEVTSTILGVHGVTAAGGFRLAVAGSVSWDDYGDITRRTGFPLFPEARSDTDGKTHAVSVEGGYTVDVGPLSIGPRVGLRHIRARVDGYTESGAGPLALATDTQTLRSTVSSLGAEASTRVSLAGWDLEPALRLAWEHEYADNDRTVTVRLPGGAFNSVRPEGGGNDALVVGAGLAARFAGAVTASVAYEGNFQGSDSHEHRLAARVRMGF